MQICIFRFKANIIIYKLVAFSLIKRRFEPIFVILAVEFQNAGWLVADKDFNHSSTSGVLIFCSEAQSDLTRQNFTKANQ